MRVTLHPAAERDMEEAAGFYAREGSAVLATRFVNEFKKLCVLLVEQPEVGSPRSAGRRGLCMKVFPYTVIHSASTDEIKILVVKHDRKRPGYGSSRA